jgi:putative Holliday junction resolvase
MRTISLTEIREKFIAPETRVLALDVSKSSIGVAVATMALRVVTPLKTIKRAGIKADASALNGVLRDYPSQLMVVGWPLNMDGTEGARCQSVRDSMVEIMKFLPDLPILYWDERLSTADGDKLVESLGDIQGNLRDKQGIKPRDHLAAKVILESFFENV